jgi:hypothetical protein
MEGNNKTEPLKIALNDVHGTAWILYRAEVQTFVKPVKILQVPQIQEFLEKLCL